MFLCKICSFIGCGSFGLRPTSPKKSEKKSLDLITEKCSVLREFIINHEHHSTHLSYSCMAWSAALVANFISYVGKRVGEGQNFYFFNVAIVRLKSHGLRLEIACFENSVLSRRSRV